MARGSRREGGAAETSPEPARPGLSPDLTKQDVQGVLCLVQARVSAVELSVFWWLSSFGNSRHPPPSMKVNRKGR